MQGFINTTITDRELVEHPALISIDHLASVIDYGEYTALIVEGDTGAPGGAEYRSPEKYADIVTKIEEANW
jgi:hypothetical protein